MEFVGKHQNTLKENMTIEFGQFEMQIQRQFIRIKNEHTHKRREKKRERGKMPKTLKKLC